MMRLALALLGAVTTLSASTICQGRYPKAIEPEQAAVFALLDGFDARDNSERPFVKVLPEGRPESGWPPTPYDSGYGFLLEATARGFVVQMVNGNRLRFATTRPSAPRQRSTSFAPVDFRAFVHDWIARSRFGWEDRFEYFHRSPRTPLSPETTGLFLARACAHLGLDGELAKLWEALPPEFRSANALQGPNGLAASMLPADLNARFVLDLGDPTLRWQDHLERIEFLLATFPNKVYVPRWEALRDAVQKTLQRPRPAAAERPLSECATEELVARLDEVCLPCESGGFDEWSVPPMDPGPHGQPVFDELVRRGMDAVPALLGHLEDTTLSRSWFYCSRFTGGFEARAVRDNVIAVLEATAGQEGRYTRDFTWQAWYARVQAIGLRDHLLGIVCDTEREYQRTPSARREGSFANLLFRRAIARSAAAATTFVSRFPAEADRILDAAEAASTEHRRALLVAIVKGFTARGTAAPARLLRMLEPLLIGDDRLQAAQWLLALHDAAGARALAAAWGAGAVIPADEMAVALQSGDPTVWAAIERGLDTAANRTTFAVTLDALSPPAVLRLTDARTAASVADALQRCLLRIVADRTAIAGDRHVDCNGRFVALHSARVADFAAAQLAAWWPDRFRFDPATTRSVRDRQITKLLGGASPDAPAGNRPRGDAIATLGSVEVGPAVRDLAPAVRRNVQDLADHPLEAGALFAALAALAKHAPGKTVRIDLERPAGSAKFVLWCDLEPAAQDADAGGHRLEIRITVAGEAIARSTRFAGASFEARDTRTSEWVTKVHRALSSSLDLGVEVTLALQVR